MFWVLLDRFVIIILFFGVYCVVLFNKFWIIIDKYLVLFCIGWMFFDFNFNLIFLVNVCEVIFCNFFLMIGCRFIFLRDCEVLLGLRWVSMRSWFMICCDWLIFCLIFVMVFVWFFLFLVWCKIFVNVFIVVNGVCNLWLVFVVNCCFFLIVIFNLLKKWFKVDVIVCILLGVWFVLIGCIFEGECFLILFVICCKCLILCYIV